MGMDMFTQFETVFWIVFALIIASFVVFLAMFIYRMVKGGKILEQTTSENQSIVKEKEIIREIVKIRCPYCGNLYDEKLDKCPHCGGGKKP